MTMQQQGFKIVIFKIAIKSMDFQIAAFSKLISQLKM